MPLNEALCIVCRDDLERFFRASIIQNEQTEELEYCQLMSTQLPVLDAIKQDNSFLLINKPRQSATSTICLMWLLQQVEYKPGRKGILIANTRDVANELFDRLLTAYSHQPEEIKVPAKRNGARCLQFVHGGKIDVLTAGQDDPGMGYSPSVVLASEFAAWDKDVLSKLIPAIAKRPNARIIIETTPGNHDSEHHKLWMAASSGLHQFKPVMIKWWEHEGYKKPAGPSFLLDEFEESLAKKYLGITPEHLSFRRYMLESACFGDERTFANKYPYDEMSGFSTSGAPALPSEGLMKLLPFSLQDPDLGKGWEGPEEGCSYLIAVDPNSYGESGDPSAVTVWHRQDKREIAAWAGRIDPIRLASVLVVLGKLYNNALLVVESNAAACITALSTLHYPHIYSTSATHPGWYAQTASKDRAHGYLVQMLQYGQLQIRSKAGIMQLLNYSGTKNRKNGHHYDRVDSYLMAADVLYSSKVQPRPAISARLPDNSFYARDLKRILSDPPKKSEL